MVGKEAGRFEGRNARTEELGGGRGGVLCQLEPGTPQRLTKIDNAKNTLL